ncbi:MAG: phospholipid carrier-dependent glycosyltransferase [Candidatus Eremiobacteraeota bacterium]|nr:phospholipid carrier-dependent glycosyltransferase [Candidatus Eremiobacteraeota bacterium]
MQTGALRAAGALDRPAFNPGLVALLAAGLVLRLLFLGSQGFHNDVAAFESWTLTLRDNPPWAFYAKSGFADYPPGYFVVLWVLAKVYAVIGAGDHSYALLRLIVKLPAIAMDLVDAAVVYAIVRRFAAPRIALLGAGLLALNPAAIYTSAYWGQVDSISWGFVLVALLCVLRAGDDAEHSTTRLVWAWLAFSFSLLIKPQAATVGTMLLAYPFAAPGALRTRRLIGTGAGIAAGLGLALGISLLFHPAADVVGWLLQRYLFGSNVYPYNTVNAFNLYAVVQHFWQPDNVPLVVLTRPLWPLAAWGVLLVMAATAAIVAAYLQRRDDRAFVEGAMLCALAFFILATRMHERYLYGAFVLAIPLVAFGRTWLWTALVFSLTLYLNLAYSLAYQSVMENHVAGVDASNLWPLVSHPAALLNVAVFFVGLFRYLGASDADAVAEPHVSEGVAARARALAATARGWFMPREGIVALTRVDAMLIGGLVGLAFVVAVVGYAWPPERIFDEIYFARAGEEYLRGINQFEWTHPPFTKLVIALSMLLFGGLHGHGNTSYGWRFLNVVIGALEVGIVYAFAKRLTASTLFAALAGLLLAFDGFHFAESRLATGEITISTLIVVVLYALYRYWLAAQIRVQPIVPGRFGAPFWITLAAGVPVAAAVSWLANLQPPRHLVEIGAGIASVGADRNSYAIAFLYAMLGVYLVARTVVPRFLPARGTRASYAEGTVVTRAGPMPAKVVQPPPAGDRDLRISTTRDGSLTYATPEGTAVFSPEGTMVVDGTRAFDARDARKWLIVLACAGGLLTASKWNGAFDFVVIALVVCGVWLQRFIPLRALYGNPRGFTLDVIAAAIAFAAATAYWVAYIPFFLLGHGLADMLALQQQMYYYHSHVVATHPYSSVWWQWPIMQVPISYYYHDFRPAALAADPRACCVAEILALPNPLVFLLGLISVPAVAWLAWRERHKGYALLVIAYLVQWLPWAHSPRLLFEYHFFPNLAIIVLCDVILLQRVAKRWWRAETPWYLGAYAVCVVAMFAYFYPVVAGTKVTYQAWYARMWPDRLHIPHTSWILPPR